MQLPREQAAANLSHLGRPIATFKSDASRMVLTFFLSLLLLVGVGFYFTCGLLVRAPKGLDEAIGNLPYLFVGGVVLLAIAIVVGLRARLKLNRLRILLYPRALVIEISGTPQVVCLWSEIESLQRDAVYYDNTDILARSHYKIIRKDGNSFEFTAAEMEEQQLETLDRLLKEKADRGKVSPILDQVNSADGMKFDWLTINRKGLHNGVELLRWSDVKSVEAGDGGLLIHRLSGQPPWELTPDLQQLDIIATLIRTHANLRN